MTATTGLIIAAPSSGSGKTTLTLGILRALRQEGVAISSAKSGPDYIDPAFHSVASDRPCYNLDQWGMRQETLARTAQICARGAQLLIVEGVMGLFDGATDNSGSTADLAIATGWPVVLVIDAGGMARSAAAIIHGFNSFTPGVSIAGVIFNKVGSNRHAQLLKDACADLPVTVLGSLPNDPAIRVPERHLGLVQAAEHPALNEFLDATAAQVRKHIDLSALQELATPTTLLANAPVPPPAPLGQTIAVARDDAFAFVYPHTLADWHSSGAQIHFFSPLADEPPDSRADAIFLPGGYPELYAHQLAANSHFLGGLRTAAKNATLIYGECGGFMVLGRRLIDKQGRSHTMAGLLGTTTSFATPKLHLGYRQLQLITDSPLGAGGRWYRGHEFHYAELTGAENDAPLFKALDARGNELGPIGYQRGAVSGSFAHLIDRV